MRKCDKAREHDAIDDALKEQGLTLKNLYFLMKEKHQITLSFGTFQQYLCGATSAKDGTPLLCEGHAKWIAAELEMPLAVFNEVLLARCDRLAKRKRKTKVVDRSAHEGNFKIVPPANPEDVEKYLHWNHQHGNLSSHDAVVRVNLLDDKKYIGELCDNIAKTDLSKLLYGKLSYEDFAKFDDCYGGKADNDWLINVINTVIINVAEEMKETDKNG